MCWSLALAPNTWSDNGVITQENTHHTQIYFNIIMMPKHCKVD